MDNEVFNFKLNGISLESTSQEISVPSMVSLALEHEIALPELKSDEKFIITTIDTDRIYFKSDNKIDLNRFNNLCILVDGPTKC